MSDNILKKNNFDLTIWFPLLTVLVIWFIAFYQSIITAINVWFVSEIFTHCFFVLPISFYLIYLKLNNVLMRDFSPNYWLVFPLLSVLFLQLFGEIGDIKVFMHISAFVSLPLMIWMMIGNLAAREIRFPLFFMMFSIPIGEQLIPLLQNLTTNLAVPLLMWAGVPVFRHGLYLDIPQGRFLVAEACSGISFLITSIVFGNLYAYLSFTRRSKQLIFVLISILIPFVANALRVFGIVLIGHFFGMEYATGVDHIIYGALFYAVIIFLLIFIGEKYRDKQIFNGNNKLNINTLKVNKTQLWMAVLVVGIVLFGKSFLVINIERNKLNSINDRHTIDAKYFPSIYAFQPLTRWAPEFKNADNVLQGYMKFDNQLPIGFFIAVYDNDGKGELISSSNRFYDPKYWGVASQTKIVINLDKSILLTKLESSQGERRTLVHWYQIGRKYHISQTKTKLLQTYEQILGKQNQGAVFVFLLSEDLDEKDVIKLLDYVPTTNN